MTDDCHVLFYYNIIYSSVSHRSSISRIYPPLHNAKLLHHGEELTRSYFQNFTSIFRSLLNCSIVISDQLLTRKLTMLLMSYNSYVLLQWYTINHCFIKQRNTSAAKNAKFCLEISNAKLFLIEEQEFSRLCRVVLKIVVDRFIATSLSHLSNEFFVGECGIFQDLLNALSYTSSTKQPRNGNELDTTTCI